MSSDTSTLLREQWVVHGGRRSAFYSAMLEDVNQQRRIRWDPGCMNAVAGTVPAGRKIILEALKRTEKTKIHWKQGSIAVLDNWRILHARPAMKEEDLSRVLERIMVA